MDEHRYYGVNVKVRALDKCEGEDELRAAIGDEGLQSLWDQLAETFWWSLDSQAQERFGVEVYAEGRMGGWAVPEPHIDPEQDWRTFRAFSEFVKEELAYYTETLWPERVSERLAELEDQRNRNIVRGTN